MTIIHWFLIIALLWCKMTRCLLFNVHFALYYACKDLYSYIKEKKWKNFNRYGIRMYVGMFGHGKTLTMSHDARKLYKKYGDSLRFVSNYKLEDIPYTELVNFNQIVQLGKEALQEQPKYYTDDETNYPAYYYDKTVRSKNSTAGESRLEKTQTETRYIRAKSYARNTKAQLSLSTK